MQFRGEPNLLVRITKPKNGEVKHFVFDENGIYETNHPFTAQRLRASFEEINGKINIEKSVKETATGEEIKLKHCKKCEFACESQVDLLKHYRTDHPKGE